MLFVEFVGMQQQQQQHLSRCCRSRNKCYIHIILSSQCEASVSICFSSFFYRNFAIVQGWFMVHLCYLVCVSRFIRFNVPIQFDLFLPFWLEIAASDQREREKKATFVVFTWLFILFPRCTVIVFTTTTHTQKMVIFVRFIWCLCFRALYLFYTLNQKYIEWAITKIYERCNCVHHLKDSVFVCDCICVCERLNVRISVESSKNVTMKARNHKKIFCSIACSEYLE